MSDDHAICNPAGSCCTPKVNDDAIREAAAEAIERRARAYMLNRTEVEALAETVIDAVRPLIAAQLRERLAAAIERNVDQHAPPGGVAAWRNNGLRAAARIVRERP